ncbi:MAG: GNAT family protein [Paenisporosarcina sp.]|nr:GNAT family protein [Paenisporosarcina sp.]
MVDLDAPKKVGHLGYRVGKVFTGKGLANQALKLLLETLTNTEIKQMEAKTTTNNIASQKVLEKNGFERVVGYNEEFEIEGKKLSFIHYTWVNEWSLEMKCIDTNILYKNSSNY